MDIVLYIEAKGECRVPFGWATRETARDGGDTYIYYYYYSLEDLYTWEPAAASLSPPRAIGWQSLTAERRQNSLGVTTTTAVRQYCLAIIGGAPPPISDQVTTTKSHLRTRLISLERRKAAGNAGKQS